MSERNKKQSKPFRPASIIALSFLAIIFIGALLFTLPFMTRDGKGLSFFTGLFTATSSVCVTGLTLIDPAVTLSRWGQMLLLVLIEIGGISMVTFATFFIFMFKKRSGLRSMRLAQEYTNIDTFSQVKPLVRVIIATAVTCQVIGAVLLAFRFVPKYGAKASGLRFLRLFRHIATQALTCSALKKSSAHLLIITVTHMLCLS